VLSGEISSNMRRRERLIPEFLRSWSRSPSPPSPYPQSTAHIESTPWPSTSSTESSTPTTAHRNIALELAIERHINNLPESDRDAFRAASKTINENDLLARTREYDSLHEKRLDFYSNIRLFGSVTHGQAKMLLIIDRIYCIFENNQPVQTYVINR
jgi:hypothetical protein